MPLAPTHKHRRTPRRSEENLESTLTGLKQNVLGSREEFDVLTAVDQLVKLVKGLSGVR